MSSGNPDPVLPPPFRAAPGLANPHAQTVAGRLLRPLPSLPLRRERWETPDGDFLDLDFLPDTGGPLVLVLHGLEGHTRRRYVLNALQNLRDAGLDAVGMNFRTCSGEPNRLPRAYHSGETSDLGYVLGRLRERTPGRPLGAMGYSLGGNVLLKYLGERGRGEAPGHAPGPLPDAAVAISVPYDLAAGADLLRRSWAGRQYESFFLRSLLGKVEAKRALVEGLVDLAALAQARSLRAFDDLFTAPVHGFRDADHYYAESSSQDYLAGITTPTLLLHAEDDPVLPRDRIPRRAMTSNPHLHPVLTQRGGHVGFVEGSPWAPRFWSEAAAAAVLAGQLGASASRAASS